MQQPPTLDLRTYLRDVPDFPTKGIIFKDITPLLQSPIAFRKTIHDLARHFMGQRIDAVVGVEARGFIFGAPLAVELNAGFVPVRKQGKLPFHTIEVEYALEYGTATVQMHKDGVLPGRRVIIVDDVLATGGTLLAAKKLVEQLGGHVVGMGVVLELGFLNGRARLPGSDIFSLLQY